MIQIWLKLLKFGQKIIQIRWKHGVFFYGTYVEGVKLVKNNIISFFCRFLNFGMQI